VSAYLHKVFAAAMALMMAGAQVVCACSTPPVTREPAPAKAAACVGESKCCKAQVSKPVQPPKQEPCDKCNLKHRAEQAVPQQQAGSLPQLDLCGTVEAASLPALMDISAARPRLLETFALPPLLKDLFHVHSLLLN
jgi:hypothetical protein